MHYHLDTTKKVLNEKNREVYPDELYVTIPAKRIFQLQEQIQEYIKQHYQEEDSPDMKLLFSGVLQKAIDDA